MSPRRTALHEDVRFRVLRCLQENPEMSQRALARALGISVGSAHYCLNALIGKGLVKIGNFSRAEDKRRYAYVLTARGLSEKASLAGRFLARKRAEYEALRAEIEALQAELPEGAAPERE